MLAVSPPLTRTQLMTAVLEAPPQMPSRPRSVAASALAETPRQRASSESSQALLGLLRLSKIAAADLADSSIELTLDGVISKSVLRSLLGGLHHRDVATVRHSRRVALVAVGLAHHLGWDGRQLRILEVASLLHDIGKIGIPDNVLYKPGKLSPDEIELMALHYGVGSDVLQACRVDPLVLEIIDQSQRAYSPGGESSRSLGREIHMGARILAVADAYESLCTEQVYRQAKSHDEIMKLFTEGSGTQFDGNVVSALARWVQQDGLPFAAQPSEINDGGRLRGGKCPIDDHEAMSIRQIFTYLFTLEGLYDGFHLLDADRNFLIWSRGADSLLGRRIQDMRGQPWSCRLLGYRDFQGQAIHDDDCPLRQAMDSGRTTMSQMEALRADGPPVRLELQAIPLYDDDDVFQGVAEVFRDLARSGGKRPQEFRELKLKATRDALTNVANRGELETQLTALVGEFVRNPNEPFSVIFADADHFKRVNDTYGHQVGDQVLIDLAKLFTRETYSGELVGRYGGEEFVVLCPGTDLEQAVRRAERLRSTLQDTKIGGVERLKITASFGVAQSEPGDSVESVLRRSDKALYTAKEKGRNRTCSLTNADMLQEGRVQQAVAKPADPWLYSSGFNAVVGSEMVVYKLGGFVSDYEALLPEVTTERVIMRIGSPSWFSRFSWNPAPPPVEIELIMAGLADRRANSNLQRLHISVNVRPRGWVRDSQTFQDRAHTLVNELKQYFAAD